MSRRASDAGSRAARAASPGESASISAARGSACSPRMRAGGPDRSRPRSPGLAGLSRVPRPALARWALARADVDVLVVASRGVWTRAERSRQARRLRGLARRVRVISDARPPIAAPSAMRPGILLLAGTGSMALGRDRRGRWARAGGLGPLLGDEGSAFWIGREWLRTSTRSAEASSRAAPPPLRPTPSRESPRARPPSCAARAPRSSPSRARHRHARPGRPRRPARHDGAPPSPAPAHRGELERRACSTLPTTGPASGARPAAAASS